MDDGIVREVERLRQKAVTLLGDVRVWFTPHEKQKQFLQSGARERLFLAGNRVGKTLCGAVEMSFHLTGRYPEWWEGRRFSKPIKGWAASVSREVTRDILQRCYVGDGTTQGVLSKQDVVVATVKGGVAGAFDEVRVRHVSGGTSVLGFKSFDQGRESFQGTAREVIHLDEEPSLEIYEECLLRTATVDGCVMVTMTPLLGMTEFIRHFMADEESGIRDEESGKKVVRAGWKDAPHLDERVMAGLRASLRPHELAAREEGIPQLGRGAVYPVEEREVACARFDVPASWRRCYGVDFGWTNPTAVVWLAHDVENDVVYVTDVYSRSEATPAEHAAAIAAREGGLEIAGVCDPSGLAASHRDGKSLFSLYEAVGVRLTPADNAVEAGLMAVLERLRSGRLRVFEDLAPWWTEFRTYMRDGKGHIVKRNDHLMDATRYAVVSGLALARPLEKTAWVRQRVDWRTL